MEVNETVLLGQILGKLEVQEKTHEKLLDKVEELSTKVTTLEVSVKEQAPVLEDYKRIKQRGIGAAIGLTFGGGTVGALISDFLKKLVG